MNRKKVKGDKVRDLGILPNYLKYNQVIHCNICDCYYFIVISI